MSSLRISIIAPSGMAPLPSTAALRTRSLWRPFGLVAMNSSAWRALAASQAGGRPSSSASPLRP